MEMSRRGRVVAALAGMLLWLAPEMASAGGRAGNLGAIEHELLSNSKYVYISSQRKDGSFGTPAEIWFLFHDDAVYVGTRPDSWRARRIRAGRTRAKIAIGKVDGLSFFAEGEILKEPKVQELMLKSYALKYPDGWPKYADSFRQGFLDGSRILIRYTPLEP